MNQASSTVSDKVTVLVFKDNYAARTFHVSLSWINRLGILLGVFLTLTLISGFLAIKYYRMSVLAASDRVTEFNTPAKPSIIVTPLSLPEAATQKTDPLLIPPPIVQPATPISTPAIPNIYQFSAFPDTNLGIVPSPSELSFAIQPPRLSWEGKTLQVRFALQYIKSDQENQQGRIIILARGPESIRAYPNGILNLPGKATLIAPENGEFFSVSRFREVKANFGPLKAGEAIQSVEIFIFNTAGKILVYQTLATPNPKKVPEVPVTESPESVKEDES
ncbi:MAG: hypothetical protein ABIQ95_05100 [Bdellovibrionia bacterium]